MNTRAIFFPFDLFGSSGAGAGALLLADALQEMLSDNRRERQPTRAQAYYEKVQIKQYAFDKINSYEGWRQRARKAAGNARGKGDFLLWVTGNHLGVLPIYDELSASDTLVVQLDAHLDIYNLSDCTAELSHGNFLLHGRQPLPAIVNVGTRELLLRHDYVAPYYQHVCPAAEFAVDARPTLDYLRKAARQARRIFVDLDCDVFDPVFFPAVTHPLPFGLATQQVLAVLDAIWSPKVKGFAVSEFHPARDRDDQSLSTLVWLVEHLLLRLYETA